jgi:DNA repair protein RadC
MNAQQAAIVDQAREILRNEPAPSAKSMEPKDVQEFFQLTMAHLDHEEFQVAAFDTQGRMLGHAVLFRGTVDRVVPFHGEIAKYALGLNAWGVIVAHNHPSNNTKPSDADINQTTVLAEALKLVDIELMDAYVVTNHKVNSVADMIKKRNASSPQMPRELEQLFQHLHRL